MTQSSSNPFETGLRKLIPAVLVYIENEKSEFLMVHRIAQAQDHHLGKYNGLGGKLELDESPQEAARREVLEESGLKIEPHEFKVRGTLHFPNFKPAKKEDWLVFVIVATLPVGQTPWSSGPEGELSWVNRERILDLNLWEGDRHFIPFVLEGNPFMGTIWYQDGKVSRYSLEQLSKL